MAKRQPVYGHLQIERHGITVAFESVPLESLGEIMDRVLHDLGLLERMHELAPPPDVVQIGGYAPLDVPEEAWEEPENGPVIGFTRFRAS